jgi:hypothetical protein
MNKQSLDRIASEYLSIVGKFHVLRNVFGMELRKEAAMWQHLELGGEEGNEPAES